jgi:hypothetical protein
MDLPTGYRKQCFAILIEYDQSRRTRGIFRLPKDVKVSGYGDWDFTIYETHKKNMLRKTFDESMRMDIPYVADEDFSPINWESVCDLLKIKISRPEKIEFNFKYKKKKPRPLPAFDILDTNLLFNSLDN